MKKFSINAPNLRWFLLAGILGIIAVACISFYFIYGMLVAYNNETIIKNEEANSSDATIREIVDAKGYIESNQEALEKVDNVLTDAANYEYQDQIISDIRNIASDSHLVINRIDFEVEDATTPAATAPATGTTPAPLAVVIPGVTTATAKIVFSPQPGNKLYYQYLLDFLHKIEQNNTKLLTSDVTLQVKEVGSPIVEISELSLKVYVREEK